MADGVCVPHRNLVVDVFDSRRFGRMHCLTNRQFSGYPSGIDESGQFTEIGVNQK
jgi:hypothetical protein